MDTSAIAGVVGAAVAVVGGAAGCVRWLWRRRPRVHVTVALGWVTRGSVRTPVLDVVARNDSAFTITIMEWGMEKTGIDAVPDLRLNETKLPHTLIPGAALTQSVGPQGFRRGQVTLDAPLTAWVKDQNDRRFASKPLTAGPGPQQHGGIRSV